jgi:hypothetical protein
VRVWGGSPPPRIFFSPMYGDFVAIHRRKELFWRGTGYPSLPAQGRPDIVLQPAHNLGAQLANIGVAQRSILRAESQSVG